MLYTGRAKAPQHLARLLPDLDIVETCTTCTERPFCAIRRPLFHLYRVVSRLHDPLESWPGWLLALFVCLFVWLVFGWLFVLLGSVFFSWPMTHLQVAQDDLYTWRLHPCKKNSRSLQRVARGKTNALACISRPRHARSPQRVACDKTKSHSCLQIRALDTHDLRILREKTSAEPTSSHLHNHILTHISAHLHICTSTSLLIFICASTSLLIFTSFTHLHLYSWCTSRDRGSFRSRTTSVLVEKEESLMMSACCSERSCPRGG